MNVEPTPVFETSTYGDPTAGPNQHGHAGDDGHSLAHPVPLPLLLGVFGALMVLTVITVAATWVDLGPANIWVALAIAVIKGALVAIYFMHLRWDSPFNGVILVASLFFVSLMIGIAILDTKEYRRNYEPPLRSTAQ